MAMNCDQRLKDRNVPDMMLAGEGFKFMSPEKTDFEPLPLCINYGTAVDRLIGEKAAVGISALSTY
jgi:hypothetical protein